MFRPLLCLMVLFCAAACSSHAAPPAHLTPTPVASSASCPSPDEIIKAMDSKGWTDFKVTGRIACDAGWAATSVQLTKTASDPARAVVRLVDGKWHGITYGTDGLCQAPGMKTAPASIRKALDPYC